MINPLRGMYLGDRYFAYETGDFRETLPLRNEVQTTQGVTRSVSALGKSREAFTVTLALDSTYNIYAGTSLVGSTTWAGVSRLDDLKTFVGGAGVSMPLTFVAPYGVTYTVVPTGTIDITIFNAENPADSSNGAEFRASMTLERL